MTLILGRLNIDPEKPQEAAQRMESIKNSYLMANDGVAAYEIKQDGDILMLQAITQWPLGIKQPPQWGVLGGYFVRVA